MNEDRDAKELGKLERLKNPLMNTEKLQRAGLQVFEQECDKNDNGELVST
mgnify:CR=1 FL=1